MDLFTAYLLVMAPSVGTWLQGISAAMIAIPCIVIVMLFVAACSFIAEKRAIWDNAPKKLLTSILVVGFVLNGVSAMIPKEKQMMMLAGTYFVSNIEGIDKLPPNIIKSINSALENYSSTDKKETK